MAALAQVICPVCLTSLEWEELPAYRYESAAAGYAEVRVPDGASAQQRRHAEQGAVVRCPDSSQLAGEHYLPIDYGRHGRPVILGLVGAISSGKTHLLAAMIGELEAGGLARLGISCRPLDHSRHHRFMEENVRPLLTEQRVLDPTGEGQTHFADAFLVGAPGGAQRPVVIFDVAGAELGSDRTSVSGPRPFLEVADGLIFVIDAQRLAAPSPIGDDVFNTVLAVLAQSGRLSEINAAVVLNKADLVRFDDPVTRWLRSDLRAADPAQLARESADVYAYLDARDASSLARPLLDCARTTLHVATATGGSARDQHVYPRGVSPRRVLAPLVALLVMAGVIARHDLREADADG